VLHGHFSRLSSAFPARIGNKDRTGELDLNICFTYAPPSIYIAQQNSLS